MITVSNEAANKIRSLLEPEGEPLSASKRGLRVAVKGGGCSGLTYVLDMVDEPEEDDKVIEDQGMKLFVDRKSYVFLAGTTLDYSGGMNGKGFVFNNPNAKTTCGCGTSFSV